jgi:ribosome maturation protein Sdo1
VSKFAFGDGNILIVSGIVMAGDFQLKASQRVILLEDGERVIISANKPTKIFRAGVGV